MECCYGISGNSTGKKRVMRKFCSIIVMTFIAGFAYDLPSVNLEETSMSGKMPYSEMVGKGYTGADGDLYGSKMADNLTNNIETFKFRKQSLEESVTHLKNKKLTSFIAETDNSDNLGVLEDLSLAETPVTEVHLPESTLMEDFIEDGTSKDVTVSRPGDFIVPAPPAEDVAPVPPAEEIVPTPPFEEVVPTPPAEDTVPDTPGGEVSPDNPPDVMDTHPGFLVNEDGMIYGFSPEEATFEDGFLTLPKEGCTGILRGAFDGVGSGICDIEIPANITYIEPGALSGLTDLYGIWIADGNPNYISSDGVLFDSTGTSLLAFPSARIGTYEVPGCVTYLSDFAFANNHLEKLGMRMCQTVGISDTVFGDSDGGGLIILAPRTLLEEYQNTFAGFNVMVQ